MVDVARKTNTISSDHHHMNISPRISPNNKKLEFSTPAPPPPPLPSPGNGVAELSPASESACSAYEEYLRLPELRKLQDTIEFPGWQNELIIKPGLQGLEITFRFISTVLFDDSRAYSNKREWTRRLASVAGVQMEIIGLLCEDLEDNTTRGSVPIVQTLTSQASLLPRLATWQKTQDIALKIQTTIECEMKTCPYTLGLGEPNLSQKPRLNYDTICKPSKLHALKQERPNLQNNENQMLYTTHQLLETWIKVSRKLLDKLVSEIDHKDYQKATNLCWVLERIWKLMTDIEDLHLLMDPDDFLRMKQQLLVKSTAQTELFCFRSKGLVEITRLCKELRHKVPEILDAVVDPRGGPRIQEAAMRLYRRKQQLGGFEKIHLLQALQAIEMAVKRFYYSYKQLLVIVFGSLEANGNKAFGIVNYSNCGGDDNLLDQIFLEPTYYPSLDAAKTFLGYYWSHESELTRW